MSIETTEIQESKTASRKATTSLAVTGMTCGNCARHVTEALQSVPGVHSASVSLDSHQASVRWDAEAANVPAAIRAVEEAGYGAKVVDAKTADAGEHKLAGWQFTMWVGVLGTVILMLGEWVFRLGMTPWFQWVAFGIATVVQLVAGRPFYRGAWAQLRVGSSNMDTLVALGSSTAYGYSTWALFSGGAHHLYFMEAAAIISLISVGHWIESRVSVRASSALRQLLELAPNTARRLDASGQEQTVPVKELQPGDSILLKPGDRVPTDARVTEGQSTIDESMLTGESIPVDKAPGNPIYTGTKNLNGRVVASVTAVGEETALSHIIAAVQRAQTSRAHIQRLADRISSVFVPIVVLIALATALWWGLAPESAVATHTWLARFLWPAEVPASATAAAFIIAAAVLIIACPCAMGLATPAAIMAGSNAAASRGILVRDGAALEKAGQITAVLFDKTGTLTVGKPELAAVWVPPGPAAGDAYARQLGASLAAASTHPVSQAVVKAASEKIELHDWQEIRGSGVFARLRTSDSILDVRLGSLRWLQESGVHLEAGDPFVREWSAQGATIVGVAVGNSLTGLFAVRDAIKPGARPVVAQLRQSGLKTYLVTGDNRLTAAGIAQLAGIDANHVFAEVRPEKKAQFVRELQDKGERVAFVGDGINDAPALEQADLGIAVARASDIAREAADIILLRSEIEAVPESLSLARATLRTIKQNLFWAFFYNSVGVPLAALGFMSPILCAAAMGFSDLIVIGNALRLRRWRA